MFEVNAATKRALQNNKPGTSSEQVMACDRLRRGGPRGRPPAPRAPTTRAFTPVFDGLWGAPTQAARRIRILPGASIKRPARGSGRAQLASFNFPSALVCDSCQAPTVAIARISESTHHHRAARSEATVTAIAQRPRWAPPWVPHGHASTRCFQRELILTLALRIGSHKVPPGWDRSDGATKTRMVRGSPRVGLPWLLPVPCRGGVVRKCQDCQRFADESRRN